MPALERWDFPVFLLAHWEVSGDANQYFVPGSCSQTSGSRLVLITQRLASFNSCYFRSYQSCSHRACRLIWISTDTELHSAICTPRAIERALGIAAPHSSMYNQSYGDDYGHKEDDNLKQRIKDPLLAVVRWMKKRSPREKMVLMGMAAVMVRHFCINRARCVTMHTQQLLRAVLISVPMQMSGPIGAAY